MISFIIPTLNEESVIAKTLECLKGYSGEKEIIISDGLSSDRTAEIARSFGGVVVAHDGSHRQTIAEGRNVGAAKAQGDTLMFLDADVSMPNIDDFYTKALAIFKTRPEVVAIAVPIRVLPEFETLADRVIFSFLARFNWLVCNVFHGGASAGEFQMIRASAFKQVGGYNPSLVASEDYDLYRRLSSVGRVHFEYSITAYHTGRRAHAIGWPKLLYQWVLNGIFVILFKKAASHEWKVIR